MTPRKIVLIVDDDQRLVQGLQDYLEAQGYRVYAAYDGTQAYPLAAVRKPGVIILDVDMPTTSGLKALEQLRLHPETQNIPVIVMTGLVSADVYPAIQNAPLVSFVKKPVMPEDLLSLVRHFIPESV